MRKREYEHYRKATPEYIELLLKTVEQSPSDLGYEFGRWTAERLATYLTEQTGIDLSSSQVIPILYEAALNKASRMKSYEVREAIISGVMVSRTSASFLRSWARVLQFSH